jgi:hypothetical protein
MNATARSTKRRWQPMLLTRVGDVSAVMQIKTGLHCDPSPIHNTKRGNGPPDRNCRR